MKPLNILIMLLILATTATAVCEEGTRKKIDCPNDHREKGTFMHIRHYLQNESYSYCVNGTLTDNCEYEIVRWKHPPVSGPFPNPSPGSSGDLFQGVPEFGGVSLSLAVIGTAGGLAYLRRKK